MSINSIITSFNAGETSPLLDARVDTDKHGSSCRRLENFIPKIYGPVFRRPGMVHIGSPKLDNRTCRLIGFTFSVTTRFIIELGHQYTRFWSNDLQVVDPDDSPNPLEIATPYQEDELFAIQFVQLNDVVYMVHPNHPPGKLIRKEDNDWDYEVVNFKTPALAEENVTAVTMAAAATSGTGINLVASASTFSSDMVGSSVQIKHRRENASVEQALAGTSGTSAEIRVLGQWDLFTYGTWHGTLTIERFESGEWRTIRSFVSNSDRNVQSAGEEQTESRLRLKWTHSSAGSGSPKARLEAVDTTIRGLLKITAYTNETTVVVDVVKSPLSTDATSEWSLGAWSTKDGFPRSVAFFEQRLFYGGSRSAQQTIWSSVIGDFEDMQMTTMADSGLRFTLAATQSNPVQWMAPTNNGLIIGTAAEEWLLKATGSEEAIAPNNLEVKLQSRYGSAHIQPVGVNEVTLFVQRSRERLREYVFSFESDGYVAPDMTLLAEHITRSGIVQMAFQQQPDVVVWFVTGRGELVGMTYERAQNVVAWHRHPTNGTVESAATVYSDEGADEVWVVTRRSINGTIRRFVERFDMTVVRQQWGDPSKLCYLDCAKVITSDDPVTTVSGLSHLNGEAVSILVDGSVRQSKVVASGQVTFDLAGRDVIVGLPFTSLIQPSKREVGMKGGTAQGRFHRVDRLAVRVFESSGMEHTPTLDPPNWSRLPFRDSADIMGEATPLTTGEKDVTMGGGHFQWTDFAIRQNLPLPLNIVAIIAKHNIYEK